MKLSNESIFFVMKMKEKVSQNSILISEIHVSLSGFYNLSVKLFDNPGGKTT